MAADPTTLKVSPNTITQITAIKKNGTAITPITYTTAGPISPTPTNNYNTFSINDFLSGDIVTFSSQGYSNLDVTIGTSEVVTFTEGYQTIAFYKHAGVTYEIEDEKARQDIATKQDALTTQTAYSSKGSSTKVPQITTNNLGQVTNITEVTITQPTVNNKTITIQKNSTTVDSFTLNQSTDKTINITVPTKTSDITNDSGFLTSHQSIKTLKTDNTTTQTTSSSEAIAGSGTINLHKVSKTGSYNDLLNKPTIPTVNNSTITIQKNGTNVDSFTTNQSSDKNINITVPTKISDLNNDQGYIKNDDVLLDLSAHSLANPRRIFQEKLDDCLYKSDKRFTVTLTNFSSGNASLLFDGNSDTHCDVSEGEIGTLNITGGTNLGMSYPYGWIYCNFYYGSGPQELSNVTCRVYQDWSGHNTGWVNLTGQVVASVTYSSKVSITTIRFSTQVYGIKQIEITLDNTNGTATPEGTSMKLNSVSFFCTRTGVHSFPVLTKWGGDTIYGNLTIPTTDGSFIGNLTGNADTATKATKDASGNTITTTYATKSELPTVNNKTITIQKNSTTVDSFTLNQSTDKTINISVPTKTSDLQNDSGFLTSHQNIKTLKTDNTTAQSTSSSEAIAGSGTINLHKVSKTGSYSDLLNKPTIPATNVIPATTIANKVLVSTTTSGTAKWSDFSSAGFLKTNSSGVISVDTTSYGTYSKPSGGIPASDLAESYYLASNPSGYTSNAGTVTSVRVQAGTGLASSTSTAQSTTLNTTISVASGYKLPTTTEWSNKQDKLTAQTAYTSKGSATKVPQITTNTLGQVTGITEVDITQSTVNNSTITIQKNSTTVDSFTLNQSSDKTIDISVPTTAADVGAVSTEDGVTSVVAGATANKINVTKNGSTSTITVNYVANATSATSSSKTSGLYDKYYRAYAGAAISTYGLLMKGANGRLYPLVTPSYSAASTKAVTTIGLRPDFIWLYDGNAAVSAGGVIKADVLYPEYGSTAGNKYLNSTVPTYCDIYLCGDYDATKDLFYLSTTNASGTASTTSFYALVPYNSEPTYSNYFIQGRYYIYLGSSYSTSNYFQLKTQHPLYYYDGTNLIKVDKKVADSAISTHNSDSSAHSTLFSGKQDTLATQTAYSAKGSATKVPQITTNSLGQVTGITEIDITHPTELPSQTGQSGKYLTTNGTTASWGTVSIPTVNNSTITIQKNGTNVDSFTTNAASGKNINITLAKGDVGLGNVDNTSDLNKPISTATQTALDAKQNTISDLGYIRNKAALVDDKIGSQDITDSGDSLPSAANYSVGDTFLNKTDKKLYTVEAPAYALDSGVSNNNVDINLTTGLATFDNSSDILSRSTTFEWSGTGVVINVHFKLNSISQGVIISNSCSKYGGQSRHSLDVNLITTSDSNYLCFEYWAYGSGSKTYIFNYQLFDTVLQTNTDYYLYMVKNGDTCISTLSLNGYNNNIIETSEIPTQDVTGFQGWTPELKYGCNSWIYSSSNPGMSVYLLDSIGNFLVADGALTWNAGTTLIDNTQYNDTTNEKTIYYNNDIIYEGGSVAIDSSTITLNNNNQIQTVGYKDVRTSNTLKTWTGTKAQYDAIVTKDANTLYNITDDTDTTAAMLELLYPVGAVYIGTMDVCPLSTLGIGSWETQISRFLVEQKLPTSEDKSWYNLYSDGWCEQGGTIQTSAASGGVSSAVVTFSKPFIDQHYDFNADVVAKSDNTALYLTGLSSRSATSVTMSSKYLNGGFGAAGTVIYRWTCSYYTSITSNLKMWRRIS